MTSQLGVSVLSAPASLIAEIQRFRYSVGRLHGDLMETLKLSARSSLTLPTACGSAMDSNPTTC